ncbi:MAG TPA: acyl-CoA dehydrogenase family protein [Stellaceae bacterium]|nr:acyl-CoA dehydrogenase family protein [Stellaceae bacterium]
MNFDFSDELKQLREEARRFLSERNALGAARRVLDENGGYDKALWREIAEMGWIGAAIPEEFGGAGLGHLGLCVLAEELGAALAPVPFASSAYLAAEAILLAGSTAQKERYLPKLASGAEIGTLALAEGAGALDWGRLASTVANGRLTGAKAPVPDGDAADLAVVAALGADRRPGLFIVDLAAPGVAREGIATIDPSRGHARLVFNGAAAEPLGSPGEGAALIERLFDRAAVLFAFEQVGGAQAALDMAKAYALERYAFGRPIGSFQAIKHKLADVYVATELARSNAYYGAWALSEDAPELPVAAAAARVAASDAFWLAAKENVQTHVGMGYTWAFDCHLYYRRAKLLALALGAPRAWKERLIVRLEARNEPAPEGATGITP